MSNLNLMYIYILKLKYKPIKTTYYTSEYDKTMQGYKIRLQHPTQDFTTDVVLWESRTKDS